MYVVRCIKYTHNDDDDDDVKKIEYRTDIFHVNNAKGLNLGHWSCSIARNSDGWALSFSFFDRLYHLR
jgi:hypothetical protein